MSFEIERKAWVRDPQGLRRELERRFGPPRETLKRDRYYLEPAAAAAALGRPPRKVRLRQEDGRSVATSKARSLLPGGTEANDEVEFEVSDAEAFERFVLERLGWGVQVDKLKRTATFGAPPLSLELSEVAGLGWFFEAEQLVEEKTNIQGAADNLDGAFRDFGPFLGEVEPAPYTSLLLARQAGRPGEGGR